ncbi:hypothetical protein [Neobacillus cucumis]|uniref:hypothetical protein n=1 Tax=Neobacillus cucumis TaxID=1740721 RepID=UPI001C60B63E|nr:hypothetical protein [Neobacillus cucumis]
MEIIERDYNHPSIVTWVPLNESWGVPHISYNDQQKRSSYCNFQLTPLLIRGEFYFENN